MSQFSCDLELCHWDNYRIRATTDSGCKQLLKSMVRFGLDRQYKVGLIFNPSIAEADYPESEEELLTLLSNWRMQKQASAALFTLMGNHRDRVNMVFFK